MVCYLYESRRYLNVLGYQAPDQEIRDQLLAKSATKSHQECTIMNRMGSSDLYLPSIGQGRGLD